MKTTFLPRLACLLLLGWVLLLPAPTEAAAPAGALSASAPVAALPANRLFDYIRGNRSRMVQVATIGLAIGLVILMTSLRKH